MNLRDYGWSQYQRQTKDSPTEDSVGRIGVEHKTSFVIHSQDGDLDGIILGKFRKNAKSPAEFPKVGDWVQYTQLPNEAKAVIDRVLPRYSLLSRKSAGESQQEQIIATNVDVLFILFGLDQALNPALITRYLSMAYEGGVKPVIILNKTDKIKLSGNAIKQVAAIDPQTQVYGISAKTAIGLHQIEALIEPGKTIVFVGPSGAGKSTLVNALIGQEVQTTGDVRIADAKGRHTTTRRELFVLPGGGILIDTPGIRELENIGDGQSSQSLYDDCESLAKQCKFRNCDHVQSQGCALLSAVEQGLLDPQRYHGYLKQLRLPDKPKRRPRSAQSKQQKILSRYTGKPRKL